jgi:Ser/Thr protein kinase RdoA (MazF antagonist)
VHGDTKLDNFLFEEHTGKVTALVDLDTVMVHTWLSDWGDMARSLINIHGEERKIGDDVEIDIEVFKALARGFLESSLPLPRNEIELMVDAARIMALELGIRFLTDYLRGDTYFKLQEDSPEDWNKTRAVVQFSVFQKLEVGANKAKQYIKELQK